MPRKLNTAETIWTKLQMPHPAACWTYTGAPSTKGYGQFYFSGRRHTVHIVTWELTNGPVPDGLQLDHLCRNRICANPAHLEPVTSRENTERSPIHNVAKTHCPKGHPYFGRNLMIRKSDGGRICRICNYADACERRRRRRAAFVAQGLTARGTPRKR